MDYLVAIVLGFVEGATEFIPVSSSGHLIVARELLGVNTASGLTFDAVLQFAASLAVVVYFWKDIKNVITTFYNIVSGRQVEDSQKILFWSMVIGTLPVVFFGLLLENQMATAFRNTTLVAFSLILGSLLLAFAQFVSRTVYQNTDKFSPDTNLLSKKLTILRGVSISFFQVLALFPGVSRSGATISGGLLTGLSKDDAVRFSFLLSLPVILGSGLKKLFEVRGDMLHTGFGLEIFLGSVTAFVVGLISIGFLLKYLKNHNLNVFIWYRVVLAILILILI